MSPGEAFLRASSAPVPRPQLFGRGTELRGAGTARQRQHLGFFPCAVRYTSLSLLLIPRRQQVRVAAGAPPTPPGWHGAPQPCAPGEAASSVLLPSVRQWRSLPAGPGPGYSRTTSPIFLALLLSSSASTLLSKVSAATRKKNSLTFSPAGGTAAW